MGEIEPPIFTFPLYEGSQGWQSLEFLGTTLDLPPFLTASSKASWENKPAIEVLPARLRRKYPGEYLGNSLNEVKEMLRTAKGKEKRVLQQAKKILEQQQRLMGKLKGRH